MAQRIIRFGVIGGGLMGREFASACLRWPHLLELDFAPQIVAVCDTDPAAVEWFRQHVPTVRLATTDYRELLADPDVEAVYCAVPHNLHEQVYADTIRAGKHLMGEKPCGIDLDAGRRIAQAAAERPELLVRCSSEFPFFPGAYRLFRMAAEGDLGRIIEVEAGFWHSSDLDPNKPINWKRQAAINGAYGCMGDLGMHVLHIPFKLGWYPDNVRALLSKIVTHRPDREGRLVSCDTWDNATLACEVALADQRFPMVLSMKRIAPGHTNTWFIRIWGTRLSLEFSTKHPKQLAVLPYSPGAEQAWHVVDVGYASTYRAITGGIFEFGFPDAILQMWAAFCDELVNGPNMRQPLSCVTVEEALRSHLLFTAALESQRRQATVPVGGV